MLRTGLAAAFVALSVMLLGAAAAGAGVLTTRAGAVYEATATAQAAAGTRVCLRVRERDHGRVVGKTARCARASGRSQQLQARYRAHGTGNRLEAAVARAVSSRVLLARRAAAEGAELVVNGTFEGGLSGWSAYQGSLSLASDGVVGPAAAKVSSRKGVSNYSITPVTSQVPATVAGTTYRAGAWVRSDRAGRRLCLRIREWNGSSVSGSAQSCVTSATAWQRFPDLAYQAPSGGRRLEVYVFQSPASRGDTFEADGISLVAGAALPLAPATGLAATSVTGSGLTLVWTASVDGRVTGYRVARDGVVLGTTGTTSYAVSGLPCGTTSTYSVTALDAAGNASAPASVTAATAACPVSLPGCDRVASPTGDDSAAGTAAAPFRSVQRLVSSLTPGQTGCLADGGTFVGDVKVSVGGQPGAPITLRSAPGTRATLRGRLWVADSANDVVVADLLLDGRNPNNQASPVVNGDRVTFVGDEVTNYDTNICFVLGSDSGYGVAVGTVVRGNRIHNCGLRPATNHQHGIYVEKTRDTLIEDNVVYDNADRGIQLYPDAQNTTIRDNIIDGNGEGIIFSGDFGFASSGTTVTGNVISNSTIRYNLESWYPDGNPIGTGNLAQGNCLWNGASGNVAEQIGFVAGGNVVGDPLYVSRAAKDFRLAPGSPCAGMGPA